MHQWHQVMDGPMALTMSLQVPSYLLNAVAALEKAETNAAEGPGTRSPPRT